MRARPTRSVRALRSSRPTPRSRVPTALNHHQVTRDQSSCRQSHTSQARRCLDSTRALHLAACSSWLNTAAATRCTRAIQHRRTASQIRCITNVNTPVFLLLSHLIDISQITAMAHQSTNTRLSPRAPYGPAWLSLLMLVLDLSDITLDIVLVLDPKKKSKYSLMYNGLNSAHAS